MPSNAYKFLALAALIAAGCSRAGTTVVSTAPSMAPVETAATALPAAEASLVDGVVRYFGAAVPGATVTAYVPGGSEPLATATGNADGTFRLALPATVTPGDLVELVGVGQGHRLATVVQVPERTVLQAGSPFAVLDAGQTAAWMVLGPRLLAALQMDDAGARAVALQGLQAAADALGQMPGASFDALVATVLDAAGRVQQTPGARSAVAAAIPADAVAVIARQADALAIAIRQCVAAGHAMPDASLTGPLAVGPQTVAAVFADATAPDAPVVLPTSPPVSSSGSGAGSALPSRSATVDLSSTPADGTFATTGPITGEAR